eukprot:128287-Chlamydomonas_euryale.AAC.2
MQVRRRGTAPGGRLEVGAFCALCCMRARSHAATLSRSAEPLPHHVRTNRPLHASTQAHEAATPAETVRQKPRDARRAVAHIQGSSICRDADEPSFFPCRAVSGSTAGQPQRVFCMRLAEVGTRPCALTEVEVKFVAQPSSRGDGGRGRCMRCEGEAAYGRGGLGRPGEAPAEGGGADLHGTSLQEHVCKGRGRRWPPVP